MWRKPLTRFDFNNSQSNYILNAHYFLIYLKLWKCTPTQKNVYIKRLLQNTSFVRNRCNLTAVEKMSLCNELRCEIQCGEQKSYFFIILNITLNIDVRFLMGCYFTQNISEYMYRVSHIEVFPHFSELVLYSYYRDAVFISPYYF